VSARSITAIATDGAELAGSLWTPDAPAEPVGLLAMAPGSGPADRNNDVLFPLIRKTLLPRGIAVCSFDKRGVGGSGGDWLEAGIETQAADLASGIAAATELAPGLPIGLFGHSQGAWVVLEAARTVNARFVVTNSGPGVTPREQETYSTRNRLDRLGLVAERETAASATFDEFMLMLGDGTPFAEAERWMHDPSRERAFADLAVAGAFVPDTAERWTYAGSIIDHDPAGALMRLTVPLLAVFGALDDIVPVDVSAAEYRRRVPAGLLTLRVIAGGDHRIQIPDSHEFADGYLETLAAFAEEHFA
jgi:pimeloyl-ACP methyl ester carboxylesterase